MKRGGPLTRRAPLKARKGLQNGSSGLSRAARVKPRSPRRAEGMVERRALVRLMLAAEPVCQVQMACRGAKATDVHERLKRSRGGNYLDPIQSHAVTSCRACNGYVEDHPLEADRRRMALPSWHVCPPVGPC